MEPPSTIEIDREVLSVMDRGSRALEIACANGRTAFDLEEMGFSVTAVDIDPEAIAIATLNGQKRGSQVSFEVADGRDLPYEEGSFEICILNGFLTMLTDIGSRKRAMQEAARVLKERGHVYIADFLQTWESPAYSSRYTAHEKYTGESGTFIVTENGSTEGAELYRAHHHTVDEVRGLLDPFFVRVSERKTKFRSFHGNDVNGLIILARKR